MPLVDKKNCIPLLIFVTILPRSRLSSTPIVLTSIPCTSPVKLPVTLPVCTPALSPVTSPTSFPVTFPTHGPVTPDVAIVPTFNKLLACTSKSALSCGDVSCTKGDVGVPACDLSASSDHTPP